MVCKTQTWIFPALQKNGRDQEKDGEALQWDSHQLLSIAHFNFYNELFLGQPLHPLEVLKNAQTNFHNFQKNGRDQEEDGEDGKETFLGHLLHP